MFGSRLLHAFAISRHASMALWASMLLAVGALISGGVVDYVSLRIQQGEVQATADRAALAAAGELVTGDAAKDRVLEVAKAHVAANRHLDATVTAELLEDGGGVRVTVSSPPRVYFPGPIGANAGPVVAEAVAEVFGETQNLCVIALDKDSDRSISLDSNAVLQAPNCSVYSNSTKPKGISVLSNAQIEANLICSAGGKEGSVSNYSPTPMLDCPPMEDPLASRPPPPVGPCNFNNFTKADYTGEISPGVYCKGLQIHGNSKVTMKPGVYVIKEGDFRIDSNSEVTGAGVGVFLTGQKARFEFTSNAKVNLSAPKTGPMAGLLLMEDNTILKETQHRITSDYADRLVGTIYLPRGSFLIDANQDVSSASEFTVLVVRQLILKAGPRLVLNTDYGAIDVPLPDGVGKLEGQARLTQ
jgi:hypothetical protein